MCTKCPLAKSSQFLAQETCKTDKLNKTDENNGQSNKTDKQNTEQKKKTNCELSPMEDEDSMQAKRRDQVGLQLDQQRHCCVPGVILLLMRRAPEFTI